LHDFKKELSMRKISYVVAGILFTLCPQLFAQQGPLTVAESSGFTATSRHTDVTSFVRELQRMSSLVRVETIGTTAEGRQIPMLVIGDPVPASPADLKYDDRAVVYIQANIHAGEVEGKEATLMLARDILNGTAPSYLDELVILIVPNFNPDGNEKISTENRQNQHGPEQGVGIRYNGQNLDLNRDGIKLETPEAQGLVQNVFLHWDPVFFLDSHTHNGSYHEEPVTWTWGLNPNGDAGIMNYMETTLLQYVTERMRDTYGVLTIPHGDFMNVREPASGWVPLGPQPRYLSNYVGLRNRLSILNEQYPYAEYEARVRGAYSLFLTFLDHLHAHKNAVVELVREADRRTIARGARPDEADGIVIEFERAAIDQLLTIRGYEMELVEGFGGRMRGRPTDRTVTYDDVPYYSRYTPTRTVPMPRGYFITAHDQAVIGKLMQHGIAVEQLLEPVTATVQSFSVTDLTPSSRPNQGHYTSSVEGEYGTEEREFPAGTYYVSTAQALGTLAAYMLEPETNDALVVWNYFDRYLATQWGNAAQTYPVFKHAAQLHLVKEAVEPNG
jgi:hypothetical protein